MLAMIFTLGGIFVYIVWREGRKTVPPVSKDDDPRLSG